MTEEAHYAFSLENRIARLVVRRPDKLNALGEAMVDAVAEIGVGMAAAEALADRH